VAVAKAKNNSFNNKSRAFARLFYACPLGSEPLGAGVEHTKKPPYGGFLWAWTLSIRLKLSLDLELTHRGLQFLRQTGHLVAGLRCLIGTYGGFFGNGGDMLQFFRDLLTHQVLFLGRMGNVGTGIEGLVH